MSRSRHHEGVTWRGCHYDACGAQSAGELECQHENQCAAHRLAREDGIDGRRPAGPARALLRRRAARERRHRGARAVHDLRLPRRVALLRAAPARRQRGHRARRGDIGARATRGARAYRRRSSGCTRPRRAFGPPRWPRGSRSRTTRCSSSVGDPSCGRARSTVRRLSPDDPDLAAGAGRHPRRVRPGRHPARSGIGRPSAMPGPLSRTPTWTRLGGHDRGRLDRHVRCLRPCARRSRRWQPQPAR